MITYHLNVHQPSPEDFPVVILSEQNDAFCAKSLEEIDGVLCWIETNNDIARACIGDPRTNEIPDQWASLRDVFSVVVPGLGDEENNQ
jgi:hypothetical protein